jgi:hypothetical protein
MAQIIEGIGPDALTAVMACSLDAIITQTRQGVITGSNVTLLDKPFTERELLDKVHTVLEPHTMARAS